jgi:glycerate-2-kinase
LVGALQAALDAADPRTILRGALSLNGDLLHVGSCSFDLSRFGRLIVIGGGKASGKMAAGLEDVLGHKISAGVVTIPRYQRPKPSCGRITIQTASHPMPDKDGVSGTRKMLDLIGRPARTDLVVCLISGGGSALMVLPASGVGIDDLRVVTGILLKSGASIAEINTVRKHLSSVSGGRLAQRLYPATVLSLIVSDVVGDPLDGIASGPTAPDSTTYLDARTVLEKRRLWGRTPVAVRRVLSRGVAGEIEETPKKGSKWFRQVHNVVIGSSRIPCSAAAAFLRGKGYPSIVLSTTTQGEARDVGRTFARMLADMVRNHRPLRPPACLVSGGETTVTVRGRGAGGRNQELVLSAAIELRHLKGLHMASIGTDGVDGPTSAAGAVAGGEVILRAKAAGVDAGAYLRANDSNTFFRKAGGLLVTGPTGTNVNDIMIAMASGAVTRSKPQLVTAKA